MVVTEGACVIEHFTIGQLGCTCSIIGDRATGEAVVIDGGADIDLVMHRLEILGLRATRLLYTHAHIDHIGASADLRERTEAPTALHPGDLPLSRTLAQQAILLGLKSGPEAIFDDDIFDGDELRLGTARITALHTPGHTPGSMSFALEADGARRILTGDTLFAGAVGRWDLGGTCLGDIVTSIRTKLLPYPDDTIIVPGHGAFSTIGVERRENPYLRGIGS